MNALSIASESRSFSPELQVFFLCRIPRAERSAYFLLRKDREQLFKLDAFYGEDLGRLEKCTVLFATLFRDGGTLEVETSRGTFWWTSPLDKNAAPTWTDETGDESEDEHQVEILFDSHSNNRIANVDLVVERNANRMELCVSFVNR